MKNILKITLIFALIGIFFSCKTVPIQEEIPEEILEEEEDQFIFLPPEEDILPVSVFREVWAYVVTGREAALKPNLPITDIGWFGAEVNSYGTLVEVPNRKKLPAFNGRVHLVVACNGRALSHFVLMPGSKERKNLIADLLSASDNFDGLQIDFEHVPAKDGDAFLSFLTELRAGLKNKMFTVALPARTRRIADDVYDYARISPIVDRILVMAYDEHWSTSEPGPVASLTWCRRVADYSMRIIGKDKLIMGLPFYGRAWGKPNHSQAYVYTGIERVIKENNVTNIRRDNGIPTFNYDANVSVRVFYEDEYSLSVRMEMYKAMGVSAIGFWRLGQETPAVWKILQLEK